MSRRAGLALLAAALAAALASLALGWPLSFGHVSGNRVVVGSSSFPRWQETRTLTEAPLRWLAAVPPDGLAGVDRDGTLWIFEVSRAGLRVVSRHGEVASPESAPAATRLGGRPGVALVTRDKRLLLWAGGGLRTHEVGALLSRLTFLTPVALDGSGSDHLLAVAADGAVILIGGLSGGPRVVARAEANVLPDARITVGDLDGDGAPEAVVLSDPTDRYPHGILGDRIEAGSVTVIGLSAHGLTRRAQYVVPAPAVFEDLVPVLAPVGEAPRPAVLLARSAPGQGAAVVALGWRNGGLVLLAEGPALGLSNRWINVIGTADLSGDGAPEILAVHTPHIGGVLTAYRRRGGSLAIWAQAAGYSSHAIGSRNQDQAVVADLDGNGRAEVLVPRQRRDALAALELSGDRFVERWSVALQGPIQSNLVVTDLDGDGVLDLAVADSRALHVFLGVR